MNKVIAVTANNDFSLDLEFSSIEEVISNPPSVMTPKDRTELQDALLKGVTSLKTKVAALKNRQ